MPGQRRRRHWTSSAALIAVAAMARAEDAPAGANPITPEALKAFSEAHGQPAGNPPTASPITAVPLPPASTERPPEIVLPRSAPARQAAGSQLSDYGGFDDLRTEWTTGPSRYQLDAAGTRITSDGRFRPSQRAGISWFGSPGLGTNGGLLLGFTVAGWWARSDAATAPLLLRSYALDLNVGYGLPMGRNVQIEVVPYLGGGIAHGSVNDVVDLTGYGLDWGLRTDAVYSCDNGLQFGLTAGYGGNSSGIKSGEGTRYVIRAQGALLGGFIGLRF
jgi:hypothetical protein